MSDFTTIFDLLLSPERSTGERLATLDNLRPFLENEAAVIRLAEAARNEASVEVREAMLRLLCGADITSISNRDIYFDMLEYFATMEPEGRLRYLAVQKLSLSVMHDTAAREILAETLLYDLNPYIQKLCISGLSLGVEWTGSIMECIRQYVPVAPAECRPGLLELIKQLPQEEAQTLAIQFLEPSELPVLGMRAVNFLASMPTLLPGTMARLINCLQQTQSEDIRKAIAGLLGQLNDMGTEVFRIVLDAWKITPDQPELAQIMAGRLTANPALEKELIELFHQSPSAHLKLQLLELLRDSEIGELLVAALRDKNPWVRQTAVLLVGEKYAKQSRLFDAAIIESVKGEKLVGIRKQLLDILLNTGRKSAAMERFLIDWAVGETDPDLEGRLVGVLMDVPVTDDNRKELAPLYAKVLSGPYFPATLRAEVNERVQAFAYRDEPELKACFVALLENAGSIDELETAYRNLKTHEADLSQLSPVLIKLLYTYIAYYPQAPLDEWVQMFGKLAPTDEYVRAQLPYIISLTGATWLLTEADKADRTGTFLQVFKRAMMGKNGMQTFMEASRLLRDAWEKRTLRKADVIALYTLLLKSSDISILQTLLGVMTEGKLVTPELVQLSLDYLMNNPGADDEYIVKKYLEDLGYLDPAYKDRLTGAFNQDNYERFMRRSIPNRNNNKLPGTLNDWEYAGWFCPYSGWPVAELYFAIEPDQEIFTLLATVPNMIDTTRSLQYLILEHLWRNSSGKWAKFIGQDVGSLEPFFEALYTLIKQLPIDDLLADRAAFIFWKKWGDYVRLLKGNPVPLKLAQAAATVYSFVCIKQYSFDPELKSKQFPQPMTGMDVDIVKQNWPWSETQWSAFVTKYAIATKL